MLSICTIYLLATRSIEARARQEGRASLYDWIVYKQGSKARERKGEEQKHHSKLYTSSGHVMATCHHVTASCGNLTAICQYCFPLAP